MTGRTHDLAAISALGVVAVIHPPTVITLATLLIAILANQIGGIIPDIDQPTAPLWKNLPIGHPIGKVTDKMLGGHRFLTHSIIGAAAISFLFWLLLKFIHPLMPRVNINIIFIAFIIGIVSHLIMDTFTKEGVPWLLPIPHKFGFPPIKEFRITTGESVEKFIVFPGIIAIDIWLCAVHYNLLVSLVHSHLIH